MRLVADKVLDGGERRSVASVISRGRRGWVPVAAKYGEQSMQC